VTETPRPGDQPPPIPSSGPGMHDVAIASWREHDGTIWPSIIREMEARRDVGLERYGRPLQAWNGRDALRDLLEELLDAAAYTHQVAAEARAAEVAEVARLIEKNVSSALTFTQLLRLLANPADVEVTW
jgi:hypothetical protein